MTVINGTDPGGTHAPLMADKSRTELGQADFLRLMIAQFRNQDPFQPMDNGEFLGQLAQFGTVSGIDSLNESFAGLRSSIQSEQLLQAANLVGRSVLAATDTAWLPPAGTVTGAVELDGSSSQVQIEISDAGGQLVRRIDLGARDTGLATFEWDGRDASGAPVESGHYFVSARTVRGNSAEAVPALVRAKVESVNIGRGGTGMTLNLPGETRLAVDQVRRIL